MALYEGAGTGAILNYLAGTTDLGDGAALQRVANLVQTMQGSGSPEGAVSGIRGALYVDGSTGVLYSKTTTSGTSGWVAQATTGDITSGGDVTGPGSATSNAIALFNGTSGKIIKNSVITVDSSGNLVTSGEITASTPTSGSNNTKVATTAFVQTAISDLIDAAPSTLNTLNELAAALGDDANYASTVTSALAGKIDLSLIAAKGDLLVGTANDTIDRLAKGTDGYVLTADSAQAAGVKWAAAASGATVTYSTSEPSSPTTGAVWVDSDASAVLNSNDFLLKADAPTLYAKVAPYTDATLSATGYRNRVINGAFDVWQRGGSPTSTSGSYLADMWRAKYDGSGATRTIDRQEHTVGAAPVAGYESRYFLRWAQSVAGTGGTYNWLSTYIEGARSLAGQTATVSFWAKSGSAFTLPGLTLRQYFGTGGSPSSQVDTTVAASVSVGTSWTRYAYTVSVPSIAGKTFGSDGNDYVEVAFTLPLNSTFTFDVWGVQVEKGSLATPFEVEDFGTTLSKCQRYYEKSFTYSEIPRSPSSGNLLYGGMLMVGNSDGSSLVGQLAFAVEKRAVPQMTWYNPSGPGNTFSNGGTVVDFYTNTRGIAAYTTTLTGSRAFVNWTASAEF